MGPAETARRLGIPSGTLKTWADRSGVRWDPPIPETGDETAWPTVSGKTVRTREEFEYEVGLIKARMEKAAAYHSAKQAEVRQELQSDLLAKAQLAFTRFATASNEDLKNLAMAVATLLKEYRLEKGEATSRPVLTTKVADVVRDDHERAALRGAIERELAERGEPVRPDER